jgi:hypothetical protein
LANLEAYLLSRSDHFVGIDDDMELYPWPTKTYNEQGEEEFYPHKELVANAPDDIEHRIGTADAGSSWRTFKDHPSAGAHDVPDLTIENIEYNFPKPSIAHTAVNSRLNLGYFKPGEQQVGKIAQTFRPEHDRIARIDILVARHGALEPGFPPGQVYYYLTETTDGEPDESKRLYSVDLRFKPTETDYDPSTEFEGIEALSLYFDPEEHGSLDTTKTYALVLWFRGASSWSDDRAWFVVAADDTNGYSNGASFRGGGPGEWLPFEGIDIWFKVYYPDPPSGWGLREFHEDWIDFQTDVMKWHVEEYRSILNRVNATKGTSMELYVYSGYSGPFKDYTDRVWGNLHGGFNTRAFYSIDWDKLASVGLDYAITGFGQADISATLADLAGRAALVCGAQNEEVFYDRWWECNKKGMLWYHSPSGSYADDPRFDVPRGRSPKSIP